MKAAFIGLGVMGYPMAGHLQRTNGSTTVFNRTTSKAQDWVTEYGGQSAVSPEQAALNADIVFTCVGNDQDLRSVTVEKHGVLSSLKPGAILVDHTTASATIARELDAACKHKSVHFIDAPVSGGEQGAINGLLTIMCGGETADYDKAKPVMECYTREIRLMGPARHGQLTKMVNQICIAGLIQSLAEGIHFAENAGLDPLKVIEIISTGAAQSWQMDNRHETMVKGEYDHGFAVDWIRKDLAIALEEGRKNGSHLPIAALVDQFYSEVQSLGGSRWDTSSLLARLQSLKQP